MIDVKQQEKNLKIVVELYKKTKPKVNIIIPTIKTETIFFLEFKN